MLAYEMQNHSQEPIALPSTEVSALPIVSLTSLDSLTLAEHLQVSPEKDRLLHTKPTFLYPKNGLSGLL